MAQTCRIAIVGGGASGLVAAISAARLTDGVAVLERSDRVGKKLLATGNGRCNLTNTGELTAHLHGEGAFVSRVLDRFDAARSIAFFEELGVRCKSEEDRVYPYSDQASSVLDVLRLECARLGVLEVVNFETNSLRRMGEGFLLANRKGDVAHAKAVIVSSGGCASPSLGSDGSGYALLHELGHEIVPAYPVLTPIRTKTEDIRALRGIRVACAVSVCIGGQFVQRESGEVLFAEYGLSGIAVLNLSVVTGAEFAQGRRDVELSLDLMEDLSPAECSNMLFARARLLAERPLEQYFTGLLHKRVGLALFKLAGVSAEGRLCGDLTPVELKRLAVLLKDWRIPATANMGFASAQASAGGAALSQFDPETLQSKLVPGLYAAGEVLDVHGDCGGYNLQWAWATGFLAGEAAALALS